ncbi:MAG: 2,3-bisphosphoglycerate-dependent phosphoglycerate mutase [Betaproteobacteria bacterium]|nr:MAG: 2,3-bisphosphoglycerate-dependent phosphoglycerate mutase [Betaproteobacteria bacterium]
MAEFSLLILIRHGESQWNLDQRFTGWADVDVTAEGVAQMQDAAAALREAGLRFDVGYSSVLRRCIRSLRVLLDTLDCMWVPEVLDWRLNERHYGALTGRAKAEAIRLYGEEIVHRWRRSYDAQPPPVDTAAALHIPLDERYAMLAPDQIPLGESLARTVERVRAAWEESISLALRRGQRVAVVGHGNGLRALVKIIEEQSDEGITRLEIPNGVPIAYELDNALRPVRKRTLPVPARRRTEIL